ncbi:MAG: hypothetical protein OET44_10565 [Gammaproteobacteria bacterium]|nr:hypothetical protein [Gammaproteobacteria bacterium]
MPGLTDYIRRHWRGEHSLAKSFWVSFVLVSVATLAVQALTPLVISEPQALLYASFAEFLLFRVLVYPWQAVGVLRACEKALQDYVPFYFVRPAQALVLLGIIWVAVDGLGVLHVRNVAIDRATRQQQLESAQIRPYSITMHSSRRFVHVRGPLDNGVTRDLRAFLAQHGTTEAIVLDSEGGSIYEGRGLARLIAEHRLATYSLSGCDSACATAFIGGSRRWLAPAAKLGFHQYHLQAKNVLPNVDSATELRRDFEQFARHGIDTARLRPALTTPSEAMWYPDHELLLAAGVIHGIALPPGL